MQQYGYIGTYTTGRSQGIYRFVFDTQTGILSDACLFARAKHPKAVIRQGQLLASAIQMDGSCGVALWDTGRIGELPVCICCPEKQTPCHLRFSDTNLLAANYHEGTLSIYRIGNGQLSCRRQIPCGKMAGCHQSIALGTYTLVPCLEQHQVRVFDQKFDPCGLIGFPQKSGPRHGVVCPEDGTLWMVTERSHELYHFTFTGAGFEKTQTLAILNPEYAQFAKSATAAIRLSLDNRFIYVSTRGADVISVFARGHTGAQLIQQIPCGGRHPRDFILSEDGRFVLVLCRDSDDLLSIACDPDTGLLGQIVSHITIPEGSSICL